ncbi:MAG: hypothetical protein IT160_13465 [Bryobacterales bacterium]|nr:hypothetical protein [Bryobacterales bacterium]
MEPEPNTSLDLIDQLATFFPSNISRAETALSRYPVHNLSKTDSISIHIHRKGDSGDADIQWAVSPSREYGEPRQLAYKVDTLIVNRRIDQAGRPIPRVIRLGSLRELCSELDLVPGGDNFTGLRLALLQNASAFITAKLSYRSADGVTRKFEAGFTRYSVVFTGDEMPSGQRATAVHILLNEHYWKLLNKAQFRPLDYDYQKSLRPAAHRFYELVSFLMFGSLNKGHPEVRLLYSDYCLRAPQERYPDRARMQKQMYKIHKPHLDSEYITKVRYVKTADAEGAPDWEILYTPGRRARAHFTFFKKGIAQASAAATAVSAETPVRRLRSTPAPAKQPLAAPVSPVVRALMERGVAASTAAGLIPENADEGSLMDALEWGDHLIAAGEPGAFRNPAGFYIYLIREGITAPADFESSRGRAARLAEAGKREQRQLEQMRLEQAYNEYLERETATFIERNLTAADLDQRAARSRQELAGQFRNLTAEQFEDLVRRAVIAEIRRTIPRMSFEEFCRTCLPAATGDPAQPPLF